MQKPTRDAAVLIGLGLLLTPLVGCAEKVRFGFHYDYPMVRPNPPAGLVAAYTLVVDGRADRSIDAAFKADPIPTISEIVGREIEATLMFKRVLPILQSSTPSVDELRSTNVDVLLEPTLERLEGGTGLSRSTKMSVMTALFGVVGLGIAASLPADVDGHAGLSVRMTDLVSGSRVIKTYSGKSVYHETVSDDSDSEMTTELVAVRALKAAMEQLRADLVRYAQEGHLPPP